MERELPKGWEWTTLGDAADIIMGQSPSGTSYNENGDGTPFLQGNAEFGDTFPKHKKFTTEPSKLAPKGSVLISVRAPVGDTNIADLNYCIGRGLAAISLKNGDNKYLLYLLRSMLPVIEAKGTGSTFKAISKSIINEIEIPLPPLPIQCKIVAVLEQTEAVKRQRQEADALTGALLQSVFYEMFGDPVRNEKGWDIMELEKMSTHIIDCPHSTPEYEEDVTSYPCIRTTELKDGYIDWTQMKYLNEKNYFERISRLTPDEGDIVFGREGSFGVAIRVPKNVKICLGQRVMLFRPDQKYCNSEFLWALLNSDAILRQANSKTSGSTVAHINVTDIKKFEGICPPLTLQQQFARIVQDVERIRERQAASGKEIAGLCEGLMARAFAGEIVA